MSFDISKYRSPNDTDIEWQYKKLFIETHFDKIEEKQLLCLAQCYSNVERLGVRYSKELMKKLQEFTSDFPPKIKELVKQSGGGSDDLMSKMNKKFNDIKFIQSSATEDDHFKNKKQEISLQTVPLPNIEPQQKSTSPSTLNNAFNNLILNNNNKPPTPIKATRNVLLNNLTNNQQKPPVESIFNQSSLENIEKLKKIDKLRDQLRDYTKNRNYSFGHKTDECYVDIVDLMFTYCRHAGVFIEYKCQQILDCSYSGVLYLDQYKITNNVHKKKKKCKLSTYIDAFNLLISNCSLAVRSIQNIGQSEVEYELYNIDGIVVFREHHSQIRKEEVELSSSSSLDDLSTDNNSKSNKKHQMIKDAIPEFIILVRDNDVFTEKNSIAILRHSCSKNLCKLDMDLTLKQFGGEGNEEDKFKCKCVINKVKVSVSHSKNRQDAKRIAALRALKTLQKLYPTIQEGTPSLDEERKHLNVSNENEEENRVEQNSEGTILITKIDLINRTFPELVDNAAAESNTFSESNFAHSLLLKMGWKGEGHGIGKDEQGISEPISLQVYSNRQGLGSKEMVPFSYASNDFERNVTVQADISRLKDKTKILKGVRQFLNDYLQSPCFKDIQFESAFSKDDRKLIHQIANRIGLKTQSIGVDPNRYLTIGKKKSTMDILEGVVANSGQYGKYKLINK